MKVDQSKKSSIKQTPPNEGSGVTSSSNINFEEWQNTLATSTPSKSTTGQINSESVTINPPMSYGWICPKCGRVNAPWKDHCDCSNGIAVPDAPLNTPFYNPPTEIPIPFKPCGPTWNFNYDNPLWGEEYELPKGPTAPYEWGDVPGWWHRVPTCETAPKEGEFVLCVEYPDGHIEKCPSLDKSTPYGPSVTPCASPAVGDPNLTTINTQINTPTGDNLKIKAYS